MKARITDKKVFESLSAMDVSAYLRSEGWTLTGFMGTSATVWRKGEEQVLLPQDSSYADYARRMAEILDRLAEVENRSQLEIIRDLSTASSDVVRIRVISPLSDDGSMSLDAGVALFESSKDILSSGARAAVDPRAYFRGQLPGKADGYLRKVRFGQTEHGSYVVTVVCPVSPELQPQLDIAPNVDEPFDRRVTRTLATALHKSALAAQEAGVTSNMTPFTSAVRDGVSSNLCSAIAEIGDKLEESRIEISFSWARSRKRPEVASSRIMIPQSSVPILKEAARVLKETYRDDDFEVFGFVVQNTSFNLSEGGEILVFCEVDGTPRKVKLQLDPVDYSKAVDSHQKDWMVRCRGQLEKQGRYWTLTQVRDFQAIEGDY